MPVASILVGPAAQQPGAVLGVAWRVRPGGWIGAGASAMSPASTLVGMVTRSQPSLDPPFPFTLLSLCEILSQKDREIPRARLMSGENKQVFVGLQEAEARPGSQAAHRGACAHSQPRPDMGASMSASWAP